jgi:hypothetical protein
MSVRQCAGEVLQKPLSGVIITALMMVGAQAAELTNVHGEVLINHGYGFQQIAGSTMVGSGDRVRAAQGTAKIIYENGCAVDIGPNQVIAVLSTPPACTRLPATAQNAAGLALAGGAAVGAIALSGGGPLGSITFLGSILPASP